LNAVARALLLVAIAGLAMTGALLAKTENTSTASSSVTIPGHADAAIAETLPARHVDVRISDPSDFNATLRVYADDQAAAVLSGENATALWSATFHGPDTLSLEPANRGEYLFVYHNLDDHLTSLVVSHRQAAGADHELLRIALITTGLGVLGAILSSGLGRIIARIADARAPQER
jgi:hypothetical protein